MAEHIDREILTRDNIKKDLRAFYIPSIAVLSVETIVILPISVFAFIKLVINKDFSLTFFLILLSVVFHSSILAFVIYMLQKIKKINNNKFSIKIEKLHYCKKEYLRSYHISYDFCKFWLDVLCFNTGKYTIGNSSYYEWSKINRMSTKGLINSSKIGDEFYIICDEKEKIRMVYNCKLFELKGE